MVRGIVTRHKRYVQVVACFDAEGGILPLSVVWEDGRRFQVDAVKDRRMAASLKCGGTGIRFTISVCGHDTYLYYENPRWFVEEKVAEMPE